MEILKTLVGFSDEGSLFECDTILHDGEYWLVPEWLESPEAGHRRPARIIAMAGLRYQDMTGGWKQRFLLKDPMPKSVFDGRTPPQAAFGFRVVDLPEIFLEIPKGIH